MSTSYVECCFIVVEKLLFSLTFYIYYTGIFKLLQITFCLLPATRWRIFNFLSLPCIYIIKLFWNFFKFQFAGTQLPSKSQLVECALKIWQNFSNFEQMFAAGNLILKVKFWVGSPQLLVAAPFRRIGAAPSCGPAAAPTQLPNAAPPRPTSVDVARPRRTFVRNVCSPTDRSVVRDL